MTRKIALEEHFLVEGFANMGRTEGSGPAAAFRRQAAERLPEIDALRLEAMDKAGIDRAVLSLFQPGIQGERDTATAIRKAKAVNDMLAERIAKHPARFRGFAAVPMQDPRKAGDELERAVKELGFKGALVNGHTRGVYLDDARCLPFWERVAALDVPIYLHPANPMTIPAAFEGYPASRRRSSAGRPRPAVMRCGWCSPDSSTASPRSRSSSAIWARRSPCTSGASTAASRSVNPRYRSARCPPRISAGTSPLPPPASSHPSRCVARLTRWASTACCLGRLSARGQRRGRPVHRDGTVERGRARGGMLPQCGARPWAVRTGPSTGGIANCRAALPPIKPASGCSSRDGYARYAPRTAICSQGTIPRSNRTPPQRTAVSMWDPMVGE